MLLVGNRKQAQRDEKNTSKIVAKAQQRTPRQAHKAQAQAEKVGADVSRGDS